MRAPYEQLKPSYAALWASMTITRPQEISRDAAKLVGYRDRYAYVSAQTNVPVIVLAVIHNRESNARFDTFLGNGQPLNRVTTIVPKGWGPWAGANAWGDASIQILRHMGLDKVAAWDVTMALYQEEVWNGFGYRSFGVNSPYLWAGSNQYGPPTAAPGKFVSDGRFDSRYIDRQLGTAPLMKRMVELAPDLALPGMDAAAVARPKVVTPAPVGVGGIQHDARWVQAALVKLGADLAVDGSYGKWTMAAVRDFQTKAHIAADGIAGPETFTAIEAALIAKFGSADV